MIPTFTCARVRHLLQASNKPPVKQDILSARGVPDSQRGAEVSAAEPCAQGPAVCPSPASQPGQTDTVDSKGVR